MTGIWQNCMECLLRFQIKQLEEISSGFRKDFMFRLTKEERDEPVTICDRLERLKHSSSFPYAFTEQGVAMLSSVLNSGRAIQVNIAIMRAFTRLREILLTHKELHYLVKDLERRIDDHDQKIQVIFEAIKQLLKPPELPEKPKRPIGFRPG